MDDPDVERILSRYQPLPPPDHLRARALGMPAAVQRTWQWVAAAAVLLAATVGFHAASYGLRQPRSTGADDRAVVRDELTRALGGDDVARARVEIMLAAQDALRQSEPTASLIPTVQEPR